MLKCPGCGTKFKENEKDLVLVKGSIMHKQCNLDKLVEELTKQSSSHLNWFTKLVSKHIPEKNIRAWIDTEGVEKVQEHLNKIYNNKFYVLIMYGKDSSDGIYSVYYTSKEEIGYLLGLMERHLECIRDNPDIPNFLEIHPLKEEIKNKQGVNKKKIEGKEHHSIIREIPYLEGEYGYRAILLYKHQIINIEVTTTDTFRFSEGPIKEIKSTLKSSI